MTADLLTVLWKERKGLFRVQGGRSRALLTMLLPVVMIAIILPVQMGRDYLTGAWPLVASLVIPVLLVGMTIPESFAGERERHTLETLLASRLSDRAILAGKIGAAVLYGWGLTMICVLIGAVAVTAAHGKGRILFYPWPIAGGIFVLTLLVALFGSSLGVLISLRAATVRQAQQVFSVAFLILFVPIFALPMLPPSAEAAVLGWAAKANATAIGIAVVAALAVADAVLIFVADRRFRRSRLILD